MKQEITIEIQNKLKLKYIYYSTLNKSHVDLIRFKTRAHLI